MLNYIKIKNILLYTIKGLKNMTERDQVNKLFRQFKNKNVLVELRDNNQAEGKIIAIDNYLNIVLENDKGIETLKGGNIVFVSLNE